MERFRRRLYYDITTGDILWNYMAYGALKRDYLPAREAADLGLVNWGVFAWDERDPAIEAAFAAVDAEGNPRIVTVSVDVSVSPPELRFEYSAPPEIIESDGENTLEQIIDILTGEVD